MSNLNRKAEIKQERDKIANVSVLVCIAGIGGIIFSPTIPLTLAITALAGGTGYVGLRKIKKLNDEEKKL